MVHSLAETQSQPKFVLGETNKETRKYKYGAVRYIYSRDHFKTTQHVQRMRGIFTPWMPAESHIAKCSDAPSHPRLFFFFHYPSSCPLCFKVFVTSLFSFSNWGLRKFYVFPVWNNEETTAYYFRKKPEIMNKYQTLLNTCGMYVVKWESSVIDLRIWDNQLCLLSCQENYPWVPIQPHTLAEESWSGYHCLLKEAFCLC